MKHSSITCPLTTRKQHPCLNKEKCTGGFNLKEKHSNEFCQSLSLIKEWIENRLTD